MCPVAGVLLPYARADYVTYRSIGRGRVMYFIHRRPVCEEEKEGEKKILEGAGRGREGGFMRERLGSRLTNQDEGTSSGDGRRQANRNPRTFGPKPMRRGRSPDPAWNRKDSLDRRGEKRKEKKKSGAARQSVRLGNCKMTPPSVFSRVCADE
jgi:hypothetical protein